MFVLKSLFAIFDPNRIRAQNEAKLEAIEEEINNQIKAEENIKASYVQSPNDLQNPNPDEINFNCFIKDGIITKLENELGIIDKVHLFNISSVAKNISDLMVGCKVKYLAYIPEDQDGNLKIVKILSNESWDEVPKEKLEETIEDELFSVLQRTKIGTVLRREEDFLVVQTNVEEHINYKKLSLEFIPEEGDFVKVKCYIQNDESFFDNCGETIEYLSITPLVSCKRNGYIKEVRDEFKQGFIDDNCFFMFDALELGYKPKEGDAVSFEAIENNRFEDYNWRCITVALNESLTICRDIKIEDPTPFLNKNGIVISAAPQYKFENISETEVKTLVVRNESNHVHKILRCYFKIKKRESQIILLERNFTDQFFLQPGEEIVYKFQAEAKFYGFSSEIFEFAFGGNFKIARKIQIEVSESNQKNFEKLNFENNVKRRGNNYYYRNVVKASRIWNSLKDLNVIPGNPVQTKAKFVKVNISQFEVPHSLKNAIISVENRSEIKDKIEKLFSYMADDLSFENYQRRFSTLLHIEEIEQFIQFRNYDCDRAHFIKEGEYLRLNIENLAERRPSLIIGDYIYAKNPWSNKENREKQSEQTYQGFIYKVLHNRILIKFNQTFTQKYNGEDYRLEFFFSRFSFRKQHYTLHKIYNDFGKEFLFPTKINPREFPQLNVEIENNHLILKDYDREINWFNTSLNAVQMQAIKNILRCEMKLMPYVIFGPPGTGKTMTLIETILQVVKNCPEARLLIGTPSNSAADLIATRLLESKVLNTGDFIRLVSYNLIENELIPEHLKEHCGTIDIAIEGTSTNEMLVTRSGLKLRCPKHVIGKHNITIGTCMTLGTLIQLGFPNDHFTHVIIDEAGQCTEPEIMVVISQVNNKNGQIVIAGDPLQLGPIVLNQYANAKGLGISYLSRLLKRSPYVKDNVYGKCGYNPKLVTKLLYNYRSIPSVLKVFNDLFYDSELIPTINTETSVERQLLNKISRSLPINEKRDPSHGVFFYGNCGENRQDPDSPSWYNAAEATQILRFIINLYKMGITPDKIGIITPYQKQVKKIRDLLKEDHKLKLPKIGSVEEFQGQERDIILISTVRSRRELLHIDAKFALGFVKNKKRMNVAISRARALLVVFGNPHLLALDPNWEKFIRFCVENNAYTGCDLPDKLQVPMDL